jgi:hypothetical protein
MFFSIPSATLQEKTLPQAGIFTRAAGAARTGAFSGRISRLFLNPGTWRIHISQKGKTGD